MNRDEIMQLEGRELDAAVAVHVMKLDHFRIGVIGFPNYSTDHNHAAEVRARMCELYPGWGWQIIDVSDGLAVSFFKIGMALRDPVFSVKRTAETVAICRVALLAKEALG